VLHVCLITNRKCSLINISISLIDLSQDCCNTILLVYLKKLTVKDIQMVEHLKPLKCSFKRSMLRAQNKHTYIRAIANALILNGHIK
jgi:hypothetical protein